MPNLIHFLQKFDFISNEVKLTFHRKNELRLQTAFGGFLSLISLALLIGICLYFLISFIQQGTVFITSSSESSPYINLTDSYRYPILFRLSNRFSQPFESPESIYKISLKYWYGGSNHTFDEKLDKKVIDIEVEPCSLKKHFGEYQYLFATLSDLNTFFCPRIRYPNETIYGKYGDIYPYSYYHFTIKMCMKKPECLPIEEVKRKTEGVYLDFRTVDNTVDNYHKQPNITVIKSERYTVSSTVYKRLWVYFDNIKYTTDEGILFPMESIRYFSQYESIRFDTDNRNISTGLNAGIFASVSFLTTGERLIYNRRYLKIQDYLASIGGLTKFIEICAGILNYFYSQNTYYLKLIKSLSLVQTLDINRNKNNTRISKLIKMQSNNLIENPKVDLNESKDKLATQNTQILPLIVIKMNNPWYRLIPVFCYKKSHIRIFRLLVEKVKEMLNISTILLKIENNKKAINSIFDVEKACEFTDTDNRIKRINHKFKFPILNK